MDRVSVYEYDRKNRELVVNAIEKSGGQIFSWTYFAGSQTEYNFPIGTRYVFIDLSSLFYSEDRVALLFCKQKSCLMLFSRNNLLIYMLSLSADIASKHKTGYITKLMESWILKNSCMLNRTRSRI